MLSRGDSVAGGSVRARRRRASRARVRTAARRRSAGNASQPGAARADQQSLHSGRSVRAARDDGAMARAGDDPGWRHALRDPDPMTLGDRGPVLEMRGVRKAFPGVVALDGVDLTLDAGDVHMLLGENGAGKSTLMKILSGAYRMDAGEIRINGRPVDISSPREALALGIRVIYQELNLVPQLSVAENIFLGALPTRPLFSSGLTTGVVDWRT